MQSESRLMLRNIWTVRCWKDAEAKARGDAPLWVVQKKNFLPNEALGNILSCSYVAGGTYTWNIGLVDAAGFTGYVDGDTAAQIGGSNGWAEWTAYTEGTRQLLVLGSVVLSSYQAQIDNSAAQATFTISAAGNLRGSFLSLDSTKGGTGGILGSEVDFDTGIGAVVNGSIVQVEVILQAYSG